jgi:C-terminal processing protease CtpA/Prc
MFKENTKAITPSLHKNKLIRPWLTLAFFAIGGVCYASQAAQNTVEQVEVSETLVIQHIATELRNGYVFPEKGEEFANRLISMSKELQLTNSDGHEAFAKALTETLQKWSKGKHLVVEYSPQPMPLQPAPELLKKEQEFELSMWRAHNFGFERVERLPFNIGYFHLSAFGPTQDVGPLLAATMDLLANTDSLIIDLRGNFGGEEQTVSLFASYFFEQRTHLLNMYKRKNNTTEQHWSADYVEGKRYAPDKDVYILVDKHTFSAGEDFSYTMKHLNRATIVGEPSGGAAHSGDMVQLTPHFSLFLPTGRGTNPITQNNWADVGVIPDVEVASNVALSRAQQIILENILKTEKDAHRRERIKNRIAAL